MSQTEPQIESGMQPEHLNDDLNQKVPNPEVYHHESDANDNKKGQRSPRKRSRSCNSRDLQNGRDSPRDRRMGQGAHPDDEQRSPPRRETCQVYVGGISRNVVKQDLEELFSPFG